MITYESFGFLKEGGVFAALAGIYAEYPFHDVEQKTAWEGNWKEYDRLLFSNMDTVGKAGFVSVLDGRMIGFCSWDPRGAPRSVIVGHNGLLPAYRGFGYGSGQIRRMLEIFRERGYVTATVTTGDEDFFVPAQRMYAACGFTETRRFLQDGCRQIEYLLRLR